MATSRASRPQGSPLTYKGHREGEPELTRGRAWTSSLRAPGPRSEASVSTGCWSLAAGLRPRAAPLLFLAVLTQVCGGLSQSHEENWGSSPPFLEFLLKLG